MSATLMSATVSHQGKKTTGRTAKRDGRAAGLVHQFYTTSSGRDTQRLNVKEITIKQFISQ